MYPLSPCKPLMCHFILQPSTYYVHRIKHSVFHVYIFHTVLSFNNHYDVFLVNTENMICDPVQRGRIKSVLPPRRAIIQPRAISPHPQSRKVPQPCEKELYPRAQLPKGVKRTSDTNMSSTRTHTRQPKGGRVHELRQYHKRMGWEFILLMYVTEDVSMD